MTEPLRVVVVSPEPTPYRAPLFDRIAALAEIDLLVVYAGATVARRDWSVELEHRAVVLKGRVLPLSRWLHHDYPVTPGIFRVLRETQPDVVVVAGWSLFAAQAAIIWARRHNVPYLVTSESHLEEPRSRLVRALKQLVLPRVLRPAAANLVTGSLARNHALAYGVAPDRIHVFANTIDVEAFAGRVEAAKGHRPALRRELGLADDDVVVLQAARLVTQKATEDLVAAVAEANGRSSARIRLVLAGDGPERTALAGIAGDNVRFAGNVSPDLLPAFYASADIFALLSRREPWAVVVNEAAAASLPLVLSDRVGAACDLLTDGENGFLVRVGDTAAAARALARLADDEQFRLAAGLASRNAVARWSYDSSVASFQAALRGAAAVA